MSAKLGEVSYSQTPFLCCLKFRGYGFAWFYDSNLGVAIANELRAVNLCADVEFHNSAAYSGFDLDDLETQASWCRTQIGNQAFFLKRHNSIKVVEWRQIGTIVSDIIKKYVTYEKRYY